MIWNRKDGGVTRYKYPERTTMNVARELKTRADELRPEGCTKQEWYDEILARGMKGLRRPGKAKK